MGKRKRDAIAEWIERQNHIYVPPKNPRRFYPPFKISRLGTIGSIIMVTLILLVVDAYLALSLITDEAPNFIEAIVLGVIVNDLFIAVIIHNVKVSHKISLKNKQG